VALLKDAETRLILDETEEWLYGNVGLGGHGQEALHERTCRVREQLRQLNKVYVCLCARYVAGRGGGGKQGDACEFDLLAVGAPDDIPICRG